MKIRSHEGGDGVPHIPGAVRPLEEVGLAVEFRKDDGKTMNAAAQTVTIKEPSAPPPPVVNPPIVTTPAPTPTPTPTPSPSPSPSPSPTPTATPIPTATPAPTPVPSSQPVITAPEPVVETLEVEAVVEDGAATIEGQPEAITAALADAAIKDAGTIKAVNPLHGNG